MERERFRPGHVVVLILLCGLFFAVTRKFLVPVCLGLLASMLLSPIHKRLLVLTRHKSGISAAITTLLLAIVVVLPMTLTASVVVNDIASAIQTMQSQVHPGSSILELPLIANVYQKLNEWTGITEEDFLERGKQVGVAVIGFLTSFLGGLATSLPGKLMAMIFFLIAFYYGLKDGKRFAEFGRKLLPYSDQETEGLFNTVEGICKGVIYGALAAGTVQGILIGFGYWTFGIPKPLFFAILTLIFSFIPLFGSIPTGLGGVVYLIIVHRYAAAGGMAVVFFLASISDNIVKPWVLKEHAELHPLVGLISVLGGVALFGFAGIFFGPLIAALTIAVVQMRTTTTNASA